MADPALDDRIDFEFVEVRGGRVHVVKPAEPTESPQPDVIGFLLGVTRVRCGQRVVKNNGGQERSAWPTDRFADEMLCQRCVASVPASQQPRLFEHPQPDDPEDEN